MNRQEQFKAEMAALLAKYNVTMDVEESGDLYPNASAITFFSYSQYDGKGNVTGSMIDFKVGTRSVDHTDFQ